MRSDGLDVLAVWMDGANGTGGVVTARHVMTTVEQPIGTYGAELFTATRPDIASDGKRFVVVWRTKNADGNYDIVGASIDRQHNVAPLSIAVSSADERDPSVIWLGPGRFLVAYETISNGQRRLAGRVVDFGERRRATE